MPEATTTLIPYLTCKNATEAVDFYRNAFNADVVGVHALPDGRVMHANINIGGATVFICDEFPEHGALGPLSIGGTSVTLHLNVPDCDAVFSRAVEAGCTVRMPLQDMFWGDRYGSLVDPYGHSWSVATTIRQMSQEELGQAMAAMAAAA